MSTEEGGPTSETDPMMVEEEVANHIKTEIDGVNKGELKKAMEVSKELQGYLDEKADALFKDFERDVWLNFQMVRVYVQLSDKCEEYGDYLDSHVDDFYSVLDDYVAHLKKENEEEARSVGNSWHGKVQDMIK